MAPRHECTQSRVIQAAITESKAAISESISDEKFQIAAFAKKALLDYLK